MGNCQVRLEVSGMGRFFFTPLLGRKNKRQNRTFGHAGDDLSHVSEIKAYSKSPLYGVNDIYIHNYVVALTLHAVDLTRELRLSETC